MYADQRFFESLKRSIPENVIQYTYELVIRQGFDFKVRTLFLFVRDISLSKAEKTHNYHFVKDIFKDNSQIKTVFIHLDNDSAGCKVTEVISNLLKDKYTVKSILYP